MKVFEIPNEALNELVMHDQNMLDKSGQSDQSDDSDLELDTQVQTLPPIILALSSADCGVRLDKVLAKRIPEYSRSRIQQWIEAGLVIVDGAVARSKTTALGDEHVTIHPQSAPQELAFAAEALVLEILYEDSALMVINKPAGLVVHPGAGNWSGTLLNGLLHHCRSLTSVPRAGIVHRLDKDTTGLLVVAKSLISQTALVRQLQARTVKREYLALVWGAPQLKGKIDAAIGRHNRDRLRMTVSENMSAKPAVTHFEKMATGSLDGRVVSLLRCQLETGRTHQIRVHMQSIGFALVGDAIYGKQHPTKVFNRQALHAWRLGFIHPESGQPVAWSASVPVDMATLLAQAGIELPNESPDQSSKESLNLVNG
jgi:23S rRNA pseudouridine1911/1915/1917 synthase